MHVIDGGRIEKRWRRVGQRIPCLGCGRPTTGRYSPFDGYEDPYCARCIVVAPEDRLRLVAADGVVA